MVVHIGTVVHRYSTLASVSESLLATQSCTGGGESLSTRTATANTLRSREDCQRQTPAPVKKHAWIHAHSQFENRLRREVSPEIASDALLYRT